jgi:putative oxidoreductase
MRNGLLSYRSLNTDLASLFLRFIFGGLFIWHGVMKIENYDLYLSMSRSLIGLGAKVEYNLVIFAEFFCAVLITLGVLTRLSVIPLMISMSVAYFMAHKNDSFQMKELPFLFMCLSLVVFILGSGKYSVDGLFSRKKIINN